MTNTASLPFELSTESLADWLKSLSALPTASAANQLNQTLKALTRVEAVANQLTPLLIHLTPLTLHLSNNLAQLARGESQTSDTGKTYKIAKLSTQLLRHLSLAFCRMIESKQLEPTQAQLTIFHALQLIGYCQRNSTLFAEPPSATLWKKTAQLYLIAAKQDWLQLPIPCKLQEFKTQSTIEAVVKRNLLFSICGLLRYSPAEIELLFKLANQAQSLLEISLTPARNLDFYWDLSENAPYPPKQANWQNPRGTMAIKSHNLGNALRIGEISTELTPGALTKLASHLTCYDQLFASVDIGPPMLPAYLMSGFAAVSTYLLGQDKLSKIRRLSAQSAEKSLARSMSLEPLEHEKSFYKPSAGQIPRFTDQPGTNLNLLRNHSKQFMVAESPEPNCFSGEIGMLCREQQPTRLVIVRRQALYEDVALILLEPIIGETSIYQIAGTGDKPEYVIVVAVDAQNTEAYLPKGKYTLESKIALNNGPGLRLIGCLEQNDYFARFRVSFD